MTNVKDPKELKLYQTILSTESHLYFPKLNPSPTLNFSITVEHESLYYSFIIIPPLATVVSISERFDEAYTIRTKLVQELSNTIEIF
jgi:hypothetical protein